MSEDEAKIERLANFGQSMINIYDWAQDAELIEVDALCWFVKNIESSRGWDEPELEADGQPDPDGWIEWNGGECPVDGDVMVKTNLRNGAVCGFDRAKSFDWAHDGYPDLAFDIIAYRIAEDQS